MILLTVGKGNSAPWYSESINVESKVGTDRSIQSLDVMYPLSHSNSSLTFTDLRGRIDDEQSVELNLGLAHRSVISNPVEQYLPDHFTSNDAVIGYYGFADRLESEFDNTFYQATAGFEYFTRDYSLRVNGYLPEDERKPTTTFTQLQATGTQIFFEDRRNFERPLPGYDVELGRTLRFEGWQLYGRGSYFRFHHSEVAEVEGSRFRAGLQFDGSHPKVFLPEDSQLTIGLEWQEDQVREEQTFGVVRMRIPFGTQVSGNRSQASAIKTSSGSKSSPSSTSQGSATSPTGGEGESSFSPSTGEKRKEGEFVLKGSKSSPSTGEDIDGGELDARPSTHNSGLSAWQKDRLTERIERDVDIVTGQSEGSEVADTQPAMLSGTDRQLDQVGVAKEGASGRGTVSDPGRLASAVNAAGTDGTVFVLGSLPSSSIVLPDGQALLGGDAPLIESADGSLLTALAPNGADPVIEGTAGQTTIQFDTGTSGQLVKGVTLNGGRTALRGQNTDDVTLEDVTIEATGSHAVVFDESQGLSIRDNTIEGGFQAGTNFGGTIASSQVGTLSFGDNALARVSDVTVTKGNLAARDDAGRGAGNEFALENVTVESGNLLIGDNAGRDTGTFKMDTVRVTNGFLDLGDTAGFSGGTVELTNITAGDTLAIGEGAGAAEFNGPSGSFTLSHVNTGGTLTIGDNAGKFGSFAMSDVNIGGDLTIGQWAGSEGGEFTLSEVTTGGTLTIGDGPAFKGGLFEMSKVTAGETLTIGRGPAQFNGSFTMSGVNSGGGLAIGEGAARFDGSFNMSEVTTGGPLDIDEQAGADNATFTMSDVTIGGTLAIGFRAGDDTGEFAMSNVTTGGGVEIARDAGGNYGSFSMSDVTAGGTLGIGYIAGSHGGEFAMSNVTTTGPLTVGRWAGGGGGSVKISSITVQTGDLTVGTDAAYLFAPGLFRLENSNVLAGNITFDSTGNPAGVTCTGNSASGTISCP